MGKQMNVEVLKGRNMRGGGLCRQVTLKWDGIKAHQRSRRLKGENPEEANRVLKGV